MRQTLSDGVLRAWIRLHGQLSADSGATHVAEIIIVTGVLGAAALAGATVFSDALKRAWADLVGVLNVN